MKQLSLGRASALILGCVSLFSLSTQAANYCTASPVDGAAYKIINKGSDLLLNVENGSSSNGANVNTVANNGQNSQRFYVHYQTSSHYWTIEAAHSKQLVDVANDSFSNGGNVVQANIAGDKSQEWELKLQSDGTYRIVNRNSSYSLTVAGATSGANVYQNSDAGISSQRWWLEPVNVPCGSGSSDDDGGSSDDGFTVSGFASIKGDDGLNTTTGGAGGSTVTVNSCSALKSALTSSSATTVQIPDNTTIDCNSESTSSVSACILKCPTNQDSNKYTYRIPNSDISCSDLDAVGTTTKTLRGITINLTSNKTLVGLGPNSAIEGASLRIRNIKNVIIRNLSIKNVNPEIIEAGDGITVDNASHVVVDHVGFSMISDGHTDISNSNNVTLSYNHFDGYNPYVCASKHWYTNLASDSQVTFHHNFWDYTAGRNPKLYGSKTRGHIYNNYWKDIYYFSVGVDNKAQALMESNYFDDAARPHWNEGSGLIDAHVSSNIYTGQSASGKYATQDTGDTVFKDISMYSYSVDNASGLTDLTNKTGPQ